jgi:MraZ protein
MPMFLSTYTNKVDKKGRVSVPAPFRAAVSAPDFNGIVVFPSLKHAAIEGAGMDYIAKLTAIIDQLPPFSDEADAFSAILASCHQLAFDPEGRIMIPDELMAGAGISDQVCFVGRGQTFQIWEPGAWKVAEAEARSLARAQRDLLRWPAAQPNGGAPKGGQP